MTTVADRVALWLSDKGIRYAFGIVGGGLVTLWDAIARHQKTSLISVHHEQAAAMAATYANRVAGTQIACALVTTGAGSTNAITGVMAAWMDSIPLLVISGNEAYHFVIAPHPRGFGVQGFDSSGFVAPCTKFSALARPEEDVVKLLDRAYLEARFGRPGPVWVDFPQSVQRDRV